MWETLCKIPLWIWPIALWDIVWKMIALWRSARNKHLVWFIMIAILNTVGILPLIYLLTHKNNKNG